MTYWSYLRSHQLLVIFMQTSASNLLHYLSHQDYSFFSDLFLAIQYVFIRSHYFIGQLLLLSDIQRNSNFVSTHCHVQEFESPRSHLDSFLLRFMHFLMGTFTDSCLYFADTSFNFTWRWNLVQIKTTTPSYLYLVFPFHLKFRLIQSDHRHLILSFE